ncbi:StsB family radical SAM/SPASM domain sactipeptide maturase [Streptantibioticus cattleyicolor]|uniref:Radical SAM domain-containing protein n=1 Tax=Streptantibioticus cattleyicolor (strain ATCC 35852 / DSM 46488 / JCM 4925 / NBRC 14057 / NRRL 8057) TaxID=1003195 RepID=F8JKW7_STREN|nr:StsB family radical SAM/SPASM domain sactipeptide maturase [Streptantibioticus cattleyicolor]AEW99677.1 radical SAM domain-containing protein [Streptantibioticus cattleyicolor NRRL 8057 = DSM 46488]CCB71284.1 Radical SAM domain-containing protein [Streptantibioticus cattleyicolor NRRL 8057 = DSM 46488]
MKLLEQWSDLLAPEDLVYFTYGERRLVANPEVSSWCELTVAETAVLRDLVRGTGPVGEDLALERTLAKLVLNWLVYLPGRRPVMREPDPPLKLVYYAITDGCNLRCPYCYASSEKALPGELTHEESLGLVDQVAAMKAKTIIFTGGEPMMRRDLLTVAAHARDLGLTVNMITNGTLIRTPETARRIADIFDLVTVSIDGGTAELHERTRGRGTFAKTARGLRLLNEAGVVPVINHVLTPDSANALTELCEFTSGYRIRTVRLMYHSELGRAKTDDYDFGWRDYQKAQQFYWTNPAAATLLPDGPRPEKPCVVKGNCGMGGNEIYVNSLGTVYPCKLVTEPAHRAGNIRHKPLTEIFADPALADMRGNNVFSGDNLQDCRRCYIRGGCGGGCRAYHMAESGDIHRNGRHLCRILRHQMVSNYWRSLGVTGPELSAHQDELCTPRLVRDDSVHPVHEDWRTQGRTLLPLV